MRADLDLEVQLYKTIINQTVQTVVCCCVFLSALTAFLISRRCAHFALSYSDGVCFALPFCCVKTHDFRNAMFGLIFDFGVLLFRYVTCFDLGAER